jgi:hypothetical protein
MKRSSSNRFEAAGRGARPPSDLMIRIVGAIARSRGIRERFTSHTPGNRRESTNGKFLQQVRFTGQRNILQ